MTMPNFRKQLEWIGALAFTSLAYVVIYLGLTDGIWSRISDFQHRDWNWPNHLDGFVGSFAAPLIAGYILGWIVRRYSAKPWVIIAAPILMLYAIGYASDSLYPPWWNEALVRALDGILQGVFAWLGWFANVRGPQWAAAWTQRSEPTAASGERN